MSNPIKYFLLTSVMLYLFGSFITLHINPLLWEKHYRIFVGTIILAMWWVIVILKLINNEKK